MDMGTRETSSRSTSGSRASSAKNQILSMLKADHKKVRKAFKDFEKMDPQEDPDGCVDLVEQTLQDIELHAELEEQLFYPAVRGAIKEEDLIDEAEVEHMTAKVLMQQLKSLQPEDEKFAATFKVLGEYLNHHIEEEEGQMFKSLTSSTDWDALLEEMQSQREQLMQKMGMGEGQQEAEGEEATSVMPSAAGGASRGAARPQQSEARPQARESKGSSSSEKE
jgi:hemerythrin-like domain-containing protein